MRCKACDSIIPSSSIMRKLPSGEEVLEDLCIKCRPGQYDSFSVCADRDYEQLLMSLVILKKSKISDTRP